jgi:hypothetical protein
MRQSLDMSEFFDPPTKGIASCPGNPYDQERAEKLYRRNPALRREVSRLQEDVSNLLDHLARIEARPKSAGKRYSTAEVSKALDI